jgi:hypothetical protein
MGEYERRKQKCGSVEVYSVVLIQEESIADLYSDITDNFWLLLYHHSPFSGQN